MGADGVQVLGSNLADLGWGRTLPYLAMFLASNGGGWLGDYFIHSCGFRVASARKTVNTIGPDWPWILTVQISFFLLERGHAHTLWKVVQHCHEQLHETPLPQRYLQSI